MPHETEIVIKSVGQPVRFGEHDHLAAPSNVKLWHLCSVLLVVGFILGKIF